MSSVEMVSSNPNFPANLAISPSRQRSKGDQAVEGDNDTTFDTAAQEIAIEKYGIAGRVWEAAYALTLYLEGSPYLEFDPPSPFTPPVPLVSSPKEHTPLRIIELGSGTGIVGLKLAEHLGRVRSRDGSVSGGEERASGSDIVVLTDLEDVCPLLQGNLGRKSHSQGETSDDLGGPLAVQAEVRPLAWGNYKHASRIIEEIRLHNAEMHDSGSLTHIICSDLIYFPELLAPLLRTLLHLTSHPLISNPSSENPTIIISYKIRSLSKETTFWSAFGLWFTFEPVLARSARSRPISDNQLSTAGSDDADACRSSEDDSGWRRFGEPDPDDGDQDVMFVFIAKRRPESFEWHIPDDDISLLEGVGARGSEVRKGDDSFEVILLMGIGG